MFDWVNLPVALKPSVDLFWFFIVINSAILFSNRKQNLLQTKTKVTTLELNMNLQVFLQSHCDSAWFRIRCTPTGRKFSDEGEATGKTDPNPKSGEAPENEKEKGLSGKVRLTEVNKELLLFKSF